MFFVSITDGDGWRPGIGDPTFLGWFTVIAYFAAAVLAALVWRHERGICRDPLMQRSATFLRPHFWLGLAVLLALLGINKQLDLQSAITSYGRRIATAQGWYQYRRPVQVLFILFIALGALAAAAATYWYLRTSLRRYLPALIGTIYLLCFIVIRAASFHHVDRALDGHIASLRLNVLFELGGIAVIATAALAILRRERRR